MSKIESNQTIAPFLGDKMSFVTGLDPLGLQNPSTQMYSFLQPGLNNVTSHIRNYSFYCWLLDEFSKRIKTVDPNEQKTFLRKAEYLLALIAFNADEAGVSGSQFAKTQFQKGEDVFLLKDGIYNKDGGTQDSYWKYSFGVFGQYYLGSMRQMGLLAELKDKDGKELGIYRRSEVESTSHVCGLELAAAFDAGLSNDGRKLFFECHDKGRASKDELTELASDFILTRIEQDTEEAKLLLKMLSDKDTPFSEEEIELDMRKQSMLEVLKYANKYGEVNDRLFTFYAYDQGSQSIELKNNALIGWYFYQFNEYWQFACTAMLNGLIQNINTIAGPNWMKTSELVETLTGIVLNGLEERGHAKTSSITDIKIEENERDLYQSMLKGDANTRLIEGFMLIFKLNQSNSNYLSFLDEYTRERNVGADHGNDAVQYFLHQFPKENISLSRFVSEFLSINIVKRHRIVAYKKMGTGIQSTQKFIMEGDYIRQIDNFNPFFTSPRLGNLISFINVLGLLDENYNITSFGKNYLTQAS